MTTEYNREQIIEEGRNYLAELKKKDPEAYKEKIKYLTKKIVKRQIEHDLSS